MTVLVVEDDLAVRELVVEMLDHLGHRAACAENGLEALARCAETEPVFDVVLMDLDMPVMDGATAVRRLREDVRTKDVPILVVSANPPDPETAAATSGRLAKPFGMRALREALAGLPA